MRILGIDPGYATVGYGVIDTDGRKHIAVDYGAILTPKDEGISVRLKMIYDAVEKLCEKYKPDDIAVEELFFVKNVTTGIKVAQARGVIVLAAMQTCGRLYEYTPIQVKQAMTGYGQADKSQIQTMVQRFLNLKSIPKPDDAADALAIAITHALTCASGLRERMLR